jgi:hypothetical protein
MYSLKYDYYKLLQIFVSKILRAYIILSWLYLLLFVIFPSLKFELFFVVIRWHKFTDWIKGIFYEKFL